MAEIKTVNVDELYRIIRKFGYTTSGQTSEIVDAIEAAVLSANAGKGDDRLFEYGWIAAAKWADRDDLISDIQSPAYIIEKTKAIKASTTQQAIDAGKV